MIDVKDAPARPQHVLSMMQQAVRCALRHAGVTGIVFFVALAMVDVAPFVLALGMLTGWFGHAVGRTERDRKQGKKDVPSEGR